MFRYSSSFTQNNIAMLRASGKTLNPGLSFTHFLFQIHFNTSDVFSSDFPIRYLQTYSFLFHLMHVTCPTYLIFFNLILIISGQ
jgi:hypothetical protein